MGKDSWNLMFGQSYPPRIEKGSQVQMHKDEGYGSQMVPGYSGVSKTKKGPFSNRKPKPVKRK